MCTCFSSSLQIAVFCCCSATTSCQTLLRPHGLQHARLPCPSLSPRDCYVKKNKSHKLSWVTKKKNKIVHHRWEMFFKSIFNGSKGSIGKLLDEDWGVTQWWTPLRRITEPYLTTESSDSVERTLQSILSQTVRSPCLVAQESRMRNWALPKRPPAVSWTA